MHWKKVSLLGVGLLGGSLGLALRERRLAEQVIGFVRRPSTARECVRAGATHRATRHLEEALDGADLVVLCTPISQMETLVRGMAGCLLPGAIVTDVGSVKGTVVDTLAPLVRSAGGRFVGGHPMAGSERTGVTAARADLFEEAVCVVTPVPSSDTRAVKSVVELWKAVGAKVVRLAPNQHDLLVSRSSHLPHVIAAQLAHLVLRPGAAKFQGALCANGFRDTTRIASGSPEMWRDIAMSNAVNLLAAIDEFVGGLMDFKRALKKGDAAAIAQFFETAKTQRDKWAKHARAHSPE